MNTLIRSANFIAGKWNDAGTGKMLEVRNKYDRGSLLAEVPLGGADEMEAAILSAQSAFGEMRTWSARRRSELLEKLWRLCGEKQSGFADLICREAGKPITYSMREAERAALTLRIASEEALRTGGEMVPIDFDAGENKRAFSRRFPIGPIAAISPFNFPLNLAMHKIAPALAVGCPVVLKPAPQAPLSALAFAALVEEAGYPAGALNVLVCDIPEAEKLVRDERMKMLSFTGSPAVGWHLKNICGRKKVTLELGGNAAVIVDHSANLKQAAKQAAISAFAYAGQVCISTQRIYVIESVYKEFLPLLLAETENIRSGNPAVHEMVNGPLIDTGHLHRIASWVEEAKAAGAQIVCGGKVLDAEKNIYAPTLLTNTSPTMKVVSEEVFGPVAVVEPVPDFESALRAVNQSQFGLQAGVFTDSLTSVRLAHETLEVGGVMINLPPSFRVDSMPYGGIKASGLGREGVRYAMEDMTEARLLVY